MKRATLLAASAGAALLAGLGPAQAAQAPEAWWADPPAIKGSKPRPQPAVERNQVRPAVVTTQAQSEEVAAAPVSQPRPGVLTRPGTLVVETGIEYQHTDINRFVVGGVAILDTVLVGSIEASQADRDSVTASLGFRYGVTDRLEVELRIPYMYRSDRTTNTVVNTSNTVATTSLTDHGLGDIEAAVHYQMNDGEGTWPVFVGNFRVKSTTGEGPFDVKRNEQGIEEELATGSGFWGFEPSITVIAPSDPAVFYANLGYLWNMKKSVDKTVANNRTIGDVDPGDAVRLGLGMGLALNEKVSFSVGYQHDWIFGTETEFENGDFESESLSVGSLSFGVNWQMDDRAALNVSVGIGVTEDAPDVRLMARVPVALSL